MPPPIVSLYRQGTVGQTVVSAAIDPQRFSGAFTSLGSTLRVPIELSSPVSAQLLTLQGTISFPNEQNGVAIPSQPVMFNMQHLDVPLSDEQLARFERKRAGEQLVVEVRLTGLAMIGQTIATVGSSTPTTVQVGRDEWLRVVAQLDAGKRRLIELPAPPARGGLWERVDERFQKASWRLSAGDPGGAMSETRAGTEGLLSAIGAAIGRPRGDDDKAVRNYADEVAKCLDAAHEERGSDPYRLLANTVRLVYDVFGFASDVHTGLSHVERMNAELSLSIATSLYSYAAQANFAAVSKQSEASNS